MWPDSDCPFNHRSMQNFMSKIKRFLSDKRCRKLNYDILVRRLQHCEVCKDSRDLIGLFNRWFCRSSKAVPKPRIASLSWGESTVDWLISLIENHKREKYSHDFMLTLHRLLACMCDRGLYSPGWVSGLHPFFAIMNFMKFRSPDIGCSIDLIDALLMRYLPNFRAIGKY